MNRKSWYLMLPVTILFVITWGITREASASLGHTVSNDEVISAPEGAWNFDLCVDCPSAAMVSEGVLVMDGSDTPHILYSAPPDLKYAHWEDSDWVITTIGASARTDLAIDANDRLHAVARTVGGFQYGTLDNNNWQFETVNAGGNITDLALALDQSASPHVVYSTNYGQELSYAVKTITGTWNVSLLDFAHQGIYPDIDIDSHGHPHIAYQTCASSASGLRAIPDGPCDNDDFILAYSYFNGTDWQSQVVDDGWRQGWELDMMLDRNNCPHIAYNEGFGSPWNVLRYATFDGTSWQLEVIENSPNDYIYGAENSIAIDDLGRIHLSFHSFYTIGHKQIHYAIRQNGSWSVETLANGLGTSLALDSAGRPHISYQSDQPDDPGILRYAYQAPVTNYRDLGLNHGAYLPLVAANAETPPMCFQADN